MSDEEPDELQQGSEEPPLAIRLPSPPPWVRVVAVLVVLVLSGVVLLHQRHQQGPVAAPRPSVPSTAGGEPLSYFNVTAVCPPVLDGDNVLTVSFTLTNTTSSNVTVRRIEPNFPLGGLQAASIDIAGGICDHAGAAPAGLDIASASSLRVTFRLLLPTECPAPYPVAARVVVLPASGQEQADVVPVYPDLGGIDFPNCP